MPVLATPPSRNLKTVANEDLKVGIRVLQLAE